MCLEAPSTIGDNLTRDICGEEVVALKGTAAREFREGLASLHAVIDKVDIIHTTADEAALISRVERAEAPLIVSFVNQNALNLAWRSSDFASCLIHSDVLLRDGIGMKAGLSAMRRPAGRNMNGTDFIPRLAARFAGRPVALFGTVEPWTGRAAAALQKMGCQMVSTLDGFRPVDDYCLEAKRVNPDLVILAMGNPRQEAVAKAIASEVRKPVVIVNGGAIADFLSGRFERAPLWVRRAQCEWVFRLLLEPRRLWRRYLLGAFPFAWYVLWLRITCDDRIAYSSGTHDRSG